MRRRWRTGAAGPSRRSSPPPRPPPSPPSRRGGRRPSTGWWATGCGWTATTAGDEVMNVLRWRTDAGDMRRRRPATDFQTAPPFGGRAVPAVTRTEFASTGFTAAHLAGARLVGWSVPSTLVVEVRRLLGEGEPFVYAYYDGLDKVAHERGTGGVLRAGAADRRPAGGRPDRRPPRRGRRSSSRPTTARSRWGPRPASPARSCWRRSDCCRAKGASAGCTHAPAPPPTWWRRPRTRTATRPGSGRAEQIVDEGWFGGPLSAEVAHRLGDVALVARAPVAFLDPADTGETRLLARHGSLTPAEMYVPLLAWANADEPARRLGRGVGLVWKDRGRGR